MKFFKKSFLIGLILMIIYTNSISVNASSMPQEILYDLHKGETQEFTLYNPNGDIQQVIIEEIIDATRITDNTYKISFKTSNWEAGFYVVISNNQITKAYSPFHTVLRGKIQYASLIHNSNVKATYSFVYQATLLKYNTGVVATISNSNLKVTQI